MQRSHKQCGLVLLLLCGPTLLAQAAITVTDVSGHSLQLDKPARRVVALAPYIVENVYAAGAGATLVGAVAYSNFPPAARQLPQVGSSNALSYETILALQPDLILAWASGNSAAAIDKLRSLGLNVYVEELVSLDDVGRSLVTIGRLTGKTSQALAAAASYQQNINQLRAVYHRRVPVKVLYQVWNEPLQTVNGGHIISDVISLCGGINVFADAKVLAPKISLEAVFRRNPQAIIASGISATRPGWLDDWQAWPQLQAVAANNLYFVPPDVIQRHTVRISQGAALMCQQLQAVRDKQQQQQ